MLGTIVSICLWKFAERNLNPSPAELGLINTYFVDSIENFRNAVINRFRFMILVFLYTSRGLTYASDKW